MLITILVIMYILSAILIIKFLKAATRKKEIEEYITEEYITEEKVTAEYVTEEYKSKII